MVTDTISLKSGSQIHSPTLIPNPQSPTDAKILRETFARYEIEHLNGILLNLEDLSELRDELFEDRPVQSQLQSGGFEVSERYEDGIDSVPLIVYPDMSPILGYSYSGEDQELLSLSFEDGEYVIPREIDVERTLDQLSNATDEGQRKLRQNVLNDVLRERETIQNVLEFQVQQGTDIVASPSIPITSMQDFDERIQLVEDLCRTSSAITEGGLLSEDLDLMNTFSLDPSVLRRPEEGTSTREDKLVDLMTSNDPDLLGIRVERLNHELSDRVQALLDVIKRVNDATETPLLLLNADEFGLISFEYGVDAISGPIASNPYTGLASGGSTPNRGKYYHYEDLFAYSQERLMEMTRPEYRFPCYCEICERFEKIPAVNSYWNEFRRIHYLLVKDKEIKRIKETDKILREALRDMVGNSNRTELASYL